MPSAETTHGDVISNLMRERSEIVELLIEARVLLSGAAAHLRVDKMYTDLGHRVPASDAKNGTLATIDAFLQAGLFGDKN
jgi:hypothetical protein